MLMYMEKIVNGVIAGSCGSFCYLLSDLGDDNIVHFPSQDGAICLNNYCVLTTILDDCFLLTEWM